MHFTALICFFAAQFVAYFKWTNLGQIFAIEGAALIQASGLGEVPLLIALVLLAAFTNLFMGSASAKWAIMAPVFVPMFMLLGYSPALIQATYRIGDSTTNIITPVMSFFPLVVVFMERYRKKRGHWHGHLHHAALHGGLPVALDPAPHHLGAGGHPPRSGLIPGPAAADHGRMRIFTAITDPPVIRRILGHLGLSTESPTLASARGPPDDELPLWGG